MIEESIKKQIRDVQLKAVLKSKIFHPLLAKCVTSINNQSQKAKNEASVESSFEIIFYGLLKEIGYEIYPEKQKAVDTIRHITKGRIDSSVGALITEFKHRNKLKTPKQKQDAIEQIVNYIQSLAKKNESYYLGVITDGIQIKFLAYENKIVIEEEFHEIEEKDILRLIKNIISLETKALNPENLVKEFCQPDNHLVYTLVKVLYDTIKKSPTEKTHMLNSEWERLFKLGHEDKSHQKAIEERGKALAKIIYEEDLGIANQYKVLFCVQTAYAIIIKLIAYRVLSDIIFKEPLISFKSFLKVDSKSLRIFFNAYEDGSTFRQIGIDNLLEGDFFSWYCSEKQWNDKIYSTLREIIARLANYEDKTEIFHKSVINDMFRELYLNIMPEKVRHSLGEYYTPKWLAQHLLYTSLEKINN